MLRPYRADLHIHTCLSPCADLTMSPLRVVRQAVDRGLGIVAVCDHNSAENVQAAWNAARGMRLSVLPGMEVCTAEEVHILAIFGAVRPVLKLQKLVYENLDPGENAPELFGDQIVANELDEVEGYNRRLLISATRLRLERIIDEIHDLGGLAIASHVDRPSFSIIGQLGFIPPGLKIDGLELSPHLLREKATAQLPGVAGFPLLRSSDAHVLGDIGAAASIYLLAEPTLEEIGRALRAAAGRRVLGEG